MKKSSIFFIVLGGAIIIAAIAVLSAQLVSNQSSEARVAATIFPLYDIVQNVAGDELEVELVLPPGASPHTFELSPKKAARLSSVETIFAIGAGLDEWAEGIADVSNADIVELDHAVTLICHEEEEEHAHEDEHEDEHTDEHGHEDEHIDEHEEGHDGHDHGPCDPHYWLDAEIAIELVEHIAEELSELEPTSAEAFEANAASYIEELEATHAEVLEVFEGAESKDLVTFHDSYAYFADAYGLTVRGVFEPAPGREATAHEIAELHEIVSVYDIGVLYSEPQLSKSAISSFVKDLDLEIAEMDPLGGVEGRESYIDLLLYNANVIASSQ